MSVPSSDHIEPAEPHTEQRERTRLRHRRVDGCTVERCRSSDDAEVTGNYIVGNNELARVDLEAPRGSGGGMKGNGP